MTWEDVVAIATRYPGVVRLERIEAALLKELVEDAWRTHALAKHLRAHVG